MSCRLITAQGECVQGNKWHSDHTLLTERHALAWSCAHQEKNLFSNLYNESA